MPAWKPVISGAGQQVTSGVLGKSKTVPVRGTVRSVSLPPLLKCSPPLVKSQGARRGGALALTPCHGTCQGLDACCTLTNLYYGRKVMWATWSKNRTQKKPKHWVICAKCFRPELTQFSVELCSYTGQGHPMGWNASSNDAVVLHTRDLSARSMSQGLGLSVIWSFLNVLSRQLISKWSLYCLGLLLCSMTFRIPLQATVQSRKIYVKCFLLESPSGQYSSCLVKY